jgi:hypothetical protein
VPPEARTLETSPRRAHLPAEQLYRATGWREIGRVQGWAIVPGGHAVENVFFWKPVS